MLLQMTTFDDLVQGVYNNLKNNFSNTSRNFAILKIAVGTNDLVNRYQQSVEKHNESVLNNRFSDAGFDVFVPSDTRFLSEIDTKFIDMNIKTEMIYCNVANDDLTTCAFTVYPRSSISKTPLMLANHTGIIDAGYRGSLIGAFRCLRLQNDNPYIVEQNTRLLQICHPTLCPIYVLIVNENELSTTERGAGGFGSTGI
jgi:dUTP pyrophosphatase